MVSLGKNIQILFGNCLGTCLIGILSWSHKPWVEFAQQLITTKINEKSFLIAFIDAIICGICVGIAVKSKELHIIIISVITFILCGGEHVIADIFYFIASKNIHDFWAFCWIILIGNTIGGLLIAIMWKYVKKSQS